MPKKVIEPDLVSESEYGDVQLEEAITSSPKLLKKFIDFNPFIMQNQSVVELLLRLKRIRNQ